MQQAVLQRQKKPKSNLKYSLLLCAVGIALNFVGAQAALLFDLPLYLDNVGTLLTASLGGYVPGIIVGYLTNLINGIISHDTVYYGVLTVMIAVSATAFKRKGWFQKPLTSACLFSRSSAAPWAACLPGFYTAWNSARGSAGPSRRSCMTRGRSARFLPSCAGISCWTFLIKASFASSLR